VRLFYDEGTSCDWQRLLTVNHEILSAKWNFTMEELLVIGKGF
jgi:hypothetical protein